MAIVATSRGGLFCSGSSEESILTYNIMKQSRVKQAKTPSVVHTRASFGSVKWPWFVMVFGAAVFVRVLWLGEAAYRADTLHFFQWAQRGMTFGQVFSEWSTIMADTAQFPLPAALAVGLSGLFPVALSAFTVRLSDAMFGGLAVLFGAMTARELGGRRFMAFAAILWILNPFHLQLSREGYFYSALVAGSSMLVWAVVYYAHHFCSAARLPFSFYFFVGVGCLLSAYSHFTGWIIASFAALVMIVIAFMRGRNVRAARREKVNLLLVPAAVAVPLVFLPWALPYFLKDLGDPVAKAESIRVMGEVSESMASIVWSYLLTMGWGKWPGAIGLVLLGSLGVMIYSWRSRRRVVLALLVLLMLSLGFYAIIMKTRGLYVAVRHIAFLFPVYYGLLTLGLWHISDFFGRVRGGIRYGIMVAAVLYLVYPAWHVLRLTGSPTPYQDIKAWFDSSLPSGTPVLVDRWFEPWNELTIYPTTNVVFTFTGPNEPLDVYLSTNWREQAVDFFARNPDAAYFEIAKSYWEKPEVGPWEWPRTNFVRHAVIKNESGLVLRDMGLAYREDFYPANSNRVVVEIFYNTRDDVLARRRAEGKNFQVFFGAGLPYEKSGPMGIFRFQTQQFMDWRVLGRAGKLDVYNLTDAPAEASLRIDAISPRGPKLVSAGEDKRFQFSGSQMQRWMLGPLTLQPGLTTISLEDPLFDRSGNPLLVAGVEVF